MAQPPLCALVFKIPLASVITSNNFQGIISDVPILAFKYFRIICTAYAVKWLLCKSLVSGIIRIDLKL